MQLLRICQPELVGTQLRHLPQDFPYNVAEGIEHHNLWSTKPLSPERLEQVHCTFKIKSANCKPSDGCQSQFTALFTVAG